MEEPNEISTLTADFDAHGPMLHNNLRALMILSLSGFAILLLTSLLPSISSVTNWSSLLLSACTVWILFQMSAATDRYRKAAILTCVTLAGVLFHNLTGFSALSILFSICTIIAQYQEFHGHAEICEAKDPALKGAWERLFWWEMGVGLVGGFLLSAGVVIGVLVNTNSDLLTRIILILNALLNISIGLVYLNTLKKTAALYSQK